MAEQARLGLQIGSQLDSKSASAVALRWWSGARSAESQHAAALLREEELPQSSGAEPPALAR